jgi:O-antigen ligase
MSEHRTASQMGAKTNFGSAAQTFVPRPLVNGKGATLIIGSSLTVLIGLLVASYPSAIGIALITIATLAMMLARARRLGIETWQLITLFCLTGYVVLNYGFENLNIPFGPLRFLPIGELFMGLALALAIRRHQGPVFRRALHDPAIVCILALLLLTLCHLAVNIPDHGLYALRDSTVSFEALFLLLGLLWANQERNIKLLTKWMMLLFTATALYSFTFPWAQQLQSWSLISGPFHAVPLLGNYQDVAVYLLSGALFCIWVAPSVSNWPRWVLGMLAIAQLAGLALVQSRTMYVGIVLILLLLAFLRETRRMSQFVSTLARGLAALVLLIVLLSAIGWKVQGRLGPMDLAGLTTEFESIWPSSEESQALGHESDRRAWYGETWDKLQTSPSNLLLGVGFGLPLIDFMSETGQPIRQPHNSSLNVFGRLGLVGLSIWLLFLWIVMKRLWSAARQPRWTGVASSPLSLWLLTFSVLGLLDSMVQPYFEFSHSAVPFFFLLGVGLGMNQKQVMARSTAQDEVNFLPQYGTAR